ncbi:MAG: metallophosphoesterase [Planctomycetaceae bacterium]|nr:metallophosphoesterase [Planctomycetaceae bacterium]
MSRSRLLITVAAALALIWAQPSSGQKVRFAQISDLHILDAELKSPKVDSRPENESGFRWAIREMNRRNDLGPAYDFVIFTGDLGLEVLLTSSDEGVEGRLKKAASEFRKFLDQSNVNVWLMMAGNNDLLKEDPDTVKYFHQFFKFLQEETKNKNLIDFTPVGTDANTARFVKGDCYFFGFDDASFKNNLNTADRDKNHDKQKGFLKRLKYDLDVAAAGRPDNKPLYAYIFCHIPDVDDPYLHPMNNKDLTDYILAKTSRDNEKPFEKFPRSSWTVSDDVRDFWVGILKRPEVRRVFAGHLHSADRWTYQDLNWSRDPSYDPVSFEKLMVCPPLAVKNQVGEGERARGFRDVRIDGKNGNLWSEVVWLESSG